MMRAWFGKDFDELMCRLRVFAVAFFFTSLVATLIGCSAPPPISPRDAADANDTGRRVVPSTAGERDLLTQVARLPSGGSQRIGQTTVVAEDPYQAASGRICRALRVTQEKNRAVQRLACTDGKSWFFVPDVFASNPASE
jgi:hypothetical protein